MNPRNLRLNTDYPLDKVILLNPGSQSIPGNQLTTINIPHGLPFAPLVWGQWAFNSSFSVAYEFDTGPTTTASIGSAYTVAPVIQSNATNITISVPNFYGAGAFTLYYRLFSFAPSNISSVIVQNTNINVDKFMLSTDYQQVQLIKADSYSFSSGSGNVTTPIFEHNLGYSPQLLYWIEREGIIMPRQQYAQQSGVAMYTDNTTLYDLREGFWTAGTLHYRIYVNE